MYGKGAALWSDLGSFAELDLAVPRSALAPFVRGVRRIAEGAGLLAVAFGHAADGNVHVHLYREGKVAEDVFDETAEHGVGVTSRDHLHLQRSAVYLATLRAIKYALDPAGILNPGKLLPA